jgi:hypothetical protein
MFLSGSTVSFIDHDKIKIEGGEFFSIPSIYHERLDGRSTTEAPSNSPLRRADLI